MFRHVIVVTVICLAASGCSRRQQDFAWFAAAVALEVAKHASTRPAYEHGPGVAVAADVPAPSPHELQRAHDIAVELTRLAAHDARSERCPAAIRTSEQVRELDPAVFENELLRDEAIAGCLATAAPASLDMR